LAVFTINNMLV